MITSGIGSKAVYSTTTISPTHEILPSRAHASDLNGTPLFTGSTKADKIREWAYKHGLVDEEQRLIKQPYSIHTLQHYPKAIERATAFLKEPCEVISKTLQRAADILGIEISDSLQVDPIRIEFNYEDLFVFIHRRYPNLIQRFYVVGGKAIHIAGKEMCVNILAIAYGKSPSEAEDGPEWINMALIDEICRTPPDNDTQIDASSATREERIEVLNAVMEFFAEKMTSIGFDVHTYGMFVQALQKEMYDSLDFQDQSKVKIAAIRELCLTKYSEDVQGFFNDLSMFGVDNHLGFPPHDTVLRGSRYNKNCLDTRSAVRIILKPIKEACKNNLYFLPELKPQGSAIEFQAPLGNFTFNIESSDPNTSLEQSYHDRNIQAIFVPDRKKIEPDDWINAIGRSCTYNLIQKEIEKEIYQKTIEKKPKNKSTEMFFHDLLRKWWKNHQVCHTGQTSLTSYIARASRNLSLFGGWTDIDICKLWESFIHSKNDSLITVSKSSSSCAPQEVQPDPFFQIIQRAVITHSIPFSELLRSLDALLFLFSQSSLTTWEINTPIYRFHEMLVPFHGTDSLLFIEQKFFSQIQCKTSGVEDFFNLAFFIVEEGYKMIQYASPWIPFKDRLIINEGLLRGIADRWLCNSHPIICYFGFALHLAIPQYQLTNQISFLLAQNLEKILSLALDHPKSVIYAIDKFNNLALPSTIPKLNPLIAKLKNPGLKNLLLLKYLWIHTLAGSSSRPLLRHAYELLIAQLKEKNRRVQKVEKTIGIKLFCQLLHPYPTEAFALLQKIFQDHFLSPNEVFKCLYACYFTFNSEKHKTLVNNRGFLSIIIEIALAASKGLSEGVTLQISTEKMSKCLQWLIELLHQENASLATSQLIQLGTSKVPDEGHLKKGTWITILEKWISLLDSALTTSENSTVHQLTIKLLKIYTSHEPLGSLLTGYGNDKQSFRNENQTSVGPPRGLFDFIKQQQIVLLHQLREDKDFESAADLLLFLYRNHILDAEKGFQEIKTIALPCVDALINNRRNVQANDLLNNLQTISGIDLNQKILGEIYVSLIFGLITQNEMKHISLILLDEKKLRLCESQHRFQVLALQFIKNCVEKENTELELKAGFILCERYKVLDGEILVKIFEKIALSSDPSLKEKAWKYLVKYIDKNKLTRGLPNAKEQCWCYALQGLATISQPVLLEYLDSRMDLLNHLALFSSMDSSYLAYRHLLIGTVSQVMCKEERLHEWLAVRNILTAWGWEHQVEVDHAMIKQLVMTPSIPHLQIACELLKELLEKNVIQNQRYLLSPLVVSLTSAWATISHSASSKTNQDVLKVINQAYRVTDMLCEARIPNSSLIQTSTLTTKPSSQNLVSFEKSLAEMVRYLEEHNETLFKQKWWPHFTDFFQQWILKKKCDSSVFERLDLLIYYVACREVEKDGLHYSTSQEGEHIKFCHYILEYLLKRDFSAKEEKCIEYQLYLLIDIGKKQWYSSANIREVAEKLIINLLKIDTPYSLYKTSNILSLSGKWFLLDKPQSLLSYYDELIQQCEQHSLFLIDAFSLFAKIYQGLKALEISAVDKNSLSLIAYIHKSNFQAIVKAIDRILDKEISGKMIEQLLESTQKTKIEEYFIYEGYLRGYMQLSQATAVAYLNASENFTSYLQLIKPLSEIIKKIIYNGHDDGYSESFLSLIGMGMCLSSEGDHLFKSKKLFNKSRDQEERGKFFIGFIENLATKPRTSLVKPCIKTLQEYVKIMFRKAHEKGILKNTEGVPTLQEIYRKGERITADWLKLCSKSPIE